MLNFTGTRTLIDNLDTGIGAVSLTVKYNGFFDCLKSIIEREGFFALYSVCTLSVLFYCYRELVRWLCSTCCTTRFNS